MTIQQQALLEWYQHQYEATKKSLRDDCSRDYFWEYEQAEEQMINKLVYMTQLRSLIEGMKKACE